MSLLKWELSSFVKKCCKSDFEANTKRVYEKWDESIDYSAKIWFIIVIGRRGVTFVYMNHTYDNLCNLYTRGLAEPSMCMRCLLCSAYFGITFRKKIIIPCKSYRWLDRLKNICEFLFWRYVYHYIIYYILHKNILYNLQHDSHFFLEALVRTIRLLFTNLHKFLNYNHLQSKAQRYNYSKLLPLTNPFIRIHSDDLSQVWF